MGTPGGINHDRLSMEAARRVLVAIETGGADEPETTGAPLPRIDGYRIDRRLGVGAGGVTYLAHKEGSEAKIALKVLHSQSGAAYSRGGVGQRAWRELDILQQVRVPSVPRLLDFGPTDHSLYIATEFIDGTPLDRLYEYARPADLSEMRERMRLLERIARATHSLHEHGVIHRDLKPSNVIVGASGGKAHPDDRGGADGGVGEPFIIDLGIALIDAPDLHHTLTQDGQPVGTPAFMAPEQARGQRSEISTRSDIYSLGAIGYWLCTGETPHDLAGVTLHEAIRRVGSEPPRGAREIVPQLPKGLGAVLGKACAARQVDRYESAAEFAEDLCRWNTGLPIDATAGHPTRRFLRLLARRPFLTTTAASGLIAMFIIGGTALATWYINLTPVRLVLSPDGKSLSLRSRSDATLHQWHSQGGFTYFGLFEAPFAPKNKWRLGTVFTPRGVSDSELEAQLCVWSARRPYSVLWATEPDAPFIEAPPWSSAPVTAGDFLSSTPRYRVIRAIRADVFPGEPGLEWIVVHIHSHYDPSAVRIYGEDRSLLYEAWNWGCINNVVWEPVSRMLICTGESNVRPLSDYGVADTDERWARVVFAVHPRLNAHDGWVNPELTDHDQQAGWYRYLVPLDSVDGWSRVEVGLSPPTHRSAWIALVIWSSQVQNAALTLGINADGEVVYRVTNDPMRQLDPQPVWVDEIALVPSEDVSAQRQ